MKDVSLQGGRLGKGVVLPEKPRLSLCPCRHGHPVKDTGLEEKGWLQAGEGPQGKHSRTSEPDRSPQREGRWWAGGT